MLNDLDGDFCIFFILFVGDFKENHYFCASF